MKKRYISVIIIISLIISILSVPVSANGEFCVSDYYVEDNAVYLMFSDVVNISIISDSISVTDGSGNEISYTLSLQNDNNTIRIDFNDIDLNMNYIINLANNALSGTGQVIDESHTYIVGKHGDESNFNSDSDVSRWKAILDQPIRENIVKSYNGGIMMSDSASNLNTKGTFNYVRVGGVVCLNSYDSYEYFDNSILEFDYKNNDNLNIPAPKKSVFRAMFRSGAFTKIIDNGYLEVSSDHGAYALEIYNKGNSVNLAKWNGTAARFAMLGATEGMVSLNDCTNVGYTAGDIYRYRITTQNVIDDVVIKVERAKYTNGSLGAFSTVINYTDYKNENNNPIKTGTFWFNAHNTDEASLAYNAHVIDNVSFFEEHQVEIYERGKIIVDYNSNNEGNGSIRYPAKTLKHAMELIKKHKEIMPSGEISVLLREGTHRINSSLNFTAYESGFSDDERVVFKPYQNETVKLKDSVKLNTDAFSAITDENISTRIHKNAKGKVLQMNLRDQGIDSLNKEITDIGKYYRLFLDDREQDIAQWPNGDCNYVYGGYVASNILKCRETENIKNWGNVNNILIKGFLGVDYTETCSSANSIDTETGTINLSKGIISSDSTKRWKAVNVLEELDIPGEWYIDRENFMFYYYPPDGYSGKCLELAVMTEPMMTFNNTSNVAFNGLEFSQFAGGVFNGYHSSSNNIENITIDQCNFMNNNGDVINFCTYDYCSFWDYEAWTNRRGNIHNLSITNNIFYNTRGTNINVDSGDSEYLESHGLKIQNNYATQPSLTYINGNAALGRVNSIGAEITNNLVHNGPWSAISYNGSFNKFNYNEFNNTIRETTDAGTIYSGRTIMSRKNEVAYNIFANSNPVGRFEKYFSGNKAIYQDDAFCGGYIHHNMAYNGGAFASLSGSSTIVQNNTVVDFPDNGVGIRARGIDFHDKFFTDENYAKASFVEYNNKLPEIATEYELLEGGNYAYTVYNDVQYNYFVNAPSHFDSMTEKQRIHNTYTNNCFSNEYSALADPENLDLRVTKSSEAYQQNNNLLSEDFDISLVGIQWDEFDKNRILEKRDFSKLYPQQSSLIPENQIQFHWERAFDADNYRIVVATDSNFENTVINEECGYNYYQPENALSEGKYYWKVYAVNTTRTLKGEWVSKDQTGEFTVIDTAKPYLTNVKFTADKNILTTFSTDMDKSSVQQAATLTQENTGDAVAIDTVEYGENNSEIILKPANISLEQTYVLTLSADLKTINGIAGTKQYKFRITAKSVTSNFDTEEERAKWTGIIDLNARTGDIMSDGAGGALIADSQSVLSGSFARANQGAVAILDNYTDYVDCKDSVIEFDYRNDDYTAINSGYETATVFRAFFRTDQLNVNKISNYWEASSGKGAYVFELYKKGKAAHLGKWDGAQTRFTTTYAKAGLESLAENADLEYTKGDTYRYSISTINGDNGNVTINIKRAKYTEGVLEDYVSVLTYTDTTNTLLNGTFWLNAAQSDSAKNAYNAHRIDNLSFYSADLLSYDGFSSDGINCVADGIQIKFTSVIDENTLANGIYLKSGENDIINIATLTDDRSIAMIDREKIPVNGAFVLVISDVLRSVLGEELEKEIRYTFESQGYFDDFNVSTGTDDTWHVNSQNSSFIYNNELFVSNNSADNGMIDGYPCSNERAVALRNDYQNYLLENSVFEFDFTCTTNYITNMDWANLRVLLRGSGYTLNGNNILTNTGAYLLEISGYGVKAGLYKWDGQPVSVLSTSNTIGTILAPKACISEYKMREKIRYRVEMQNTEKGVEIVVSTAMYDNDGKLGEYQPLLKAVDENNPILSGGTGFVTSASRPQWSYVNGYCVDNVLYRNLISPQQIMNNVINSVEFINEQREVIANLNEHSREEVLIKCAVNSQVTAQRGTLAIALYDAISKNLLSLSLNDISVTEGQNDYEFSYTVPVITEQYTVKAFLWNSPSEMIPLAQAYN